MEERVTRQFAKLFTNASVQQLHFSNPHLHLPRLTSLKNSLMGGSGPAGQAWEGRCDIRLLPQLGYGCVCTLVSCFHETEGVSLRWLGLSSAHV